MYVYIYIYMYTCSEAPELLRSADLPAARLSWMTTCTMPPQLIRILYCINILYNI